MKKVFIVYFLILFSVSNLYSQNQNQYAGLYKPTERSGDPVGFLNLYLMPDHTYGFVFFGGVEIGVWKEFENYIIMQPDTTANESFYVFAKHHDKLTGVSLQFDGFTESSALYSFDNDSIMHPVFNPYPNCTSYPYKIHFSSEKHKSINLAALTYNLREEDINDEVEEIVYTYILDKAFNDFKIVLNKQKMQDKKPFIGTIKGDFIDFEQQKFRKVKCVEAIKEEDQIFLKQITSTINNPIRSMLFGASQDDENSTWIETEYPIFQYNKKEQKVIRFNENNLFEAKCKDKEE